MTEAPDVSLACRSSDEEYENRWNLNEEMENAFKTALQLSFPDLSEEDKHDPCLLTLEKKEMGDYYCKNVVSMCSNKTPETMLLKHTAEAIKNNLPPNDMIEDCYIHSVGFLTYRLSTTWIAKNVHKMLNEGIQTWALKLPIKRAVVYVSSRNIYEEMNVGHLRSTIIGEMLARMLDFCNVHVELKKHSRDSNQSHHNFYSYCGETLSLLRREEGLVEENEGDEVILVKEIKTIRHLIFERETKPLTIVKKNGVYDTALGDLSTLRYQLKEQNADWIVFVADVGGKEYFEMCFSAAERAGWLPTNEDEYPKTKFVGCGLVQFNDLNSGKLVDLIDYAKTRCKAVLLERVKEGELTNEELENTTEKLACGAIKYAVMKDFRVFNHTLNVDEMLNDKGNTGVYLLNTHALICSIINKSGKDIEELKMTRELTLEKDEERELGLQLLLFTEDLDFTCESVFPCILCVFLYDLSKKFTSFYSVAFQDVGGDDEEANKLLVCEATRVVMTKCFEFLSITPFSKISVSDKNMEIALAVERDDDVMESFSSDEDKEEMVSTCSSVEDKEDIVSSSGGEVKTLIKRLKYSEDSTPEEEKIMTPPLEPITSSEDSTLEEERNPNLRFQLFSAHVHVDRYDCDRKPCFLFGSIRVSDMFVSSEENGWVTIFDPPDYGYTYLFEREWHEAVPIVNNSYINTLTHPKTQRSIPFIDFLEISVELYVINTDDNILFRVSHAYTCLDSSELFYNKFSTLRFPGPDGVLELVYSVLLDPVDAVVEMTLTDYDEPLSVKIFAYYDGTGEDSSSLCVRTDSYYLTLLEDDYCVIMSDNNKVPLNTSVMAVPANRSLVIDVLIKDAANGNVIVKELFEFHAQRNGSNTGRSEGTGGCIFKLDVNWKYQVA